MIGDRWAHPTRRPSRRPNHNHTDYERWSAWCVTCQELLARSKERHPAGKALDPDPDAEDRA